MNEQANSIDVDAEGVKTFPNGVKILPNGNQIIPIEVMEQQAYEQARENQLQNHMKEAARLAAKVQVLQMQVQNLQHENSILKQLLNQDKVPEPGTIPRTVIKSLPGEQHVANKVADDIALEAKRHIAETASVAAASLNKKDAH